MEWKMEYSEPAEALKLIQSGNRVFVHGSAQTPHYLLKHLALQKDRLTDVELVFITVKGDITVDKLSMKNIFILTACSFPIPFAKR